MREGRDARRDPFQMPVKLADLDRGVGLGMGDVDAGERDPLARAGRVHGRADLAHLRPPDPHAIAVKDRVLALDLEADELARRRLLAPAQRLAPDEIGGLRFQRHGEADAGLERVGLVGEIVAREDQPRLDPAQIEPGKPHRLDAVFGAGAEHRLEDRLAVLRMAEDLVAKLAGIARARHDDRHTLGPADAAHGEAEPAEIGQGGLVRRGPDDFRHQRARARPLHRQIVHLIGRGADHHGEAKPRRLLAHPHPALVRAADPAEVLRTQTEQRAIVDHAAMRIAHRRIDDLTVAQLRHVARQHPVHQRLGIGAGHLELAQRGQVHRNHALARRPIAFDRIAFREGIRQPEAAIFDEIAGQGGKTVVEGAFTRHDRLRVGGGAPGRGAREPLARAIAAHMDVGEIPAIGRGGVVRAGRGDADQIGQRAQQHVIAGPRPRLIRNQHAMRVDAGVEEEIRRHPARAGGNAMRGQRGVEVVRAVRVPRIANVVVIFRRAGHGEGVVPAAGVLDHLDQRGEVLIVVFRVQPRVRIGVPHQRAGGGDVERVHDAAVELARIEALEIGALAAVDVEDLEEFARLHHIGLGGCRFHPQIQKRIGERIGQREAARGARRGAGDLHRQRGCRVLALGIHRRARRGDDHDALALRGEAHGLAGARSGAEKPDGAGRAQVDPPALERTAQPGERGLARGEQVAQPVHRAIARPAQKAAIDPPVRMRGQQLGALPALVVGHLDPVACPDLEHERAATGHGVALLGRAGPIGKRPARTRRRGRAGAKERVSGQKQHGLSLSSGKEGGRPEAPAQGDTTQFAR
ncbi:hypothetical protein SDC9_30437 [bioreactor metagenome]|uniref:Uncharacterized protein n=1 Tax=bioreactor metagenome TaxID=1076179 RepID=A0A644V0Q2_9ZZZZ